MPSANRVKKGGKPHSTGSLGQSLHLSVHGLGDLKHGSKPANGARPAKKRKAPQVQAVSNAARRVASQPIAVSQAGTEREYVVGMTASKSKQARVDQLAKLKMRVRGLRQRMVDLAAKRRARKRWNQLRGMVLVQRAFTSRTLRLESEADEIEAKARRLGIQTESAEHHLVPVWLRGSLTLYTKENLCRRNVSRTDSDLVPLVEPWWDLAMTHSLSFDEPASNAQAPVSEQLLSRAEYLAINDKLYRALIDPYNAADAAIAGVQDWEHDTNSANKSIKPTTMTFAQFHSSLVELADHWTDDVTSQAFGAFLLRLWEWVTVPTPTGARIWRASEDIHPEGWTGGDGDDIHMDLITAISVQDVQTVKRILMKSEDGVNAADDKGNTPFLHAARTGSRELMALLREHGAEVNSINVAGNHAVHILSEWSHYDAMDSLFTGAYGHEPFNLLEVPDAGGRTPLHIAVENRDIRMTDTLLGLGADVRYICTKGNTVLHAAAKGGSEGCTRRVLTAGADSVKGHCNKVVKYPFDVARDHGHTHLLELLALPQHASLLGRPSTAGSVSGTAIDGTPVKSRAGATTPLRSSLRPSLNDTIGSAATPRNVSFADLTSAGEDDGDGAAGGLGDLVSRPGPGNVHPDDNAEELKGSYTAGTDMYISRAATRPGSAGQHLSKDPMVSNVTAKITPSHESLDGAPTIDVVVRGRRLHPTSSVTINGQEVPFQSQDHFVSAEAPAWLPLHLTLSKWPAPPGDDRQANITVHTAVGDSGVAFVPFRYQNAPKVTTRRWTGPKPAASTVNPRPRALRITGRNFWGTPTIFAAGERAVDVKVSHGGTVIECRILEDAVSRAGGLENVIVSVAGVMSSFPRLPNKDKASHAMSRESSRTKLNDDRLNGGQKGGGDEGGYIKQNELDASVLDGKENRRARRRKAKKDRSVDAIAAAKLQPEQPSVKAMHGGGFVYARKRLDAPPLDLRPAPTPPKTPRGTPRKGHGRRHRSPSPKKRRPQTSGAAADGNGTPRRPRRRRKRRVSPRTTANTPRQRTPRAATANGIRPAGHHIEAHILDTEIPRSPRPFTSHGLENPVYDMSLSSSDEEGHRPTGDPLSSSLPRSPRRAATSHGMRSGLGVSAGTQTVDFYSPTTPRLPPHYHGMQVRSVQPSGNGIDDLGASAGSATWSPPGSMKGQFPIAMSAMLAHSLTLAYADREQEEHQLYEAQEDGSDRALSPDVVTTLQGQFEEVAFDDDGGKSDMMNDSLGTGGLAAALDADRPDTPVRAPRPAMIEVPDEFLMSYDEVASWRVGPDDMRISPLPPDSLRSPRSTPG